jgi:hypothetical protein
LGDDAPGVAPQVSLVELPEFFPGQGMALAWDSPNDAIHNSTPWSAVEGSHIAPHRRFSQETLAHRFDQMGDGEGFPLHHNDAASIWDCQFDAEIEPASSGAEADEVEGMYIHVTKLAPRL